MCLLGSRLVANCNRLFESFRFWTLIHVLSRQMQSWCGDILQTGRQVFSFFPWYLVFQPWCNPDPIATKLQHASRSWLCRIVSRSWSYPNNGQSWLWCGNGIVTKQSRCQPRVRQGSVQPSLQPQLRDKSFEYARR